MDVSTASALNLYAYQTAIGGTSTSNGASASQGSAILQALATAYSSSTSGLPSTDSLAALAGSANSLSPLVSGIYTAAVANGTSSTALSSALSGLLGTDTSSSTSLLASLGSSGLGGISSAGLSPNVTLALESYANQQDGVPTTLTAAANKALSGTDTSSASAIQGLINSSKTSTYSSLMDLLA